VVRTRLRSRVLNEILAFDMAEFLGHLRQVNAIVVSSFAGPEYTIWGYDAARDQALDAQAPVLTVQRHDGTVIPVKPLQPLLEAGDALLGAYPCWPGP
jgi:Histidine carboxylase PI chain